MIFQSHQPETIVHIACSLTCICQLDVLSRSIWNNLTPVAGLPKIFKLFIVALVRNYRDAMRLNKEWFTVFPRNFFVCQPTSGARRSKKQIVDASLLNSSTSWTGLNALNENIFKQFKSIAPVKTKRSYCMKFGVFWKIPRHCRKLYGVLGCRNVFYSIQVL